MNGLRAIVITSVVFLGAGVSRGQPPLADYFAHKVAQIEARPLTGITSAADWKAKRPELQRQLREMMGLEPMPSRTPLNGVVTATIERPDFIVEKLYYESSPGLFVTANLFRPKQVNEKLPAILYVCGHGEEKKGGVIFGNKAHYNHHAAWYAANGYVCLIVDTLQLGELPGLHHGTYREGMWWWYSRGYTPAGIEAWNGIRGIDYLISRPEVDPTRIGVTGRSGGGATSWWLGALDDRITALVPVAGITDLRNHVVDGCVQGHCDCMYIVNTYRWDYDTLAALCAPKAMLVQNTDHDPIFPDDGVRRIYGALERVYGWYGATDKLGLQIGAGGHADTTELRHPSFAFFEKWFKGKKDATITEPVRKLPVEVQRVLGLNEVPSGNKNDIIHESFVPRANVPSVPSTMAEWSRLRDSWMKEVREKVFGGWPARSDVGESQGSGATRVETNAAGSRIVRFASEPGADVSVIMSPGLDKEPGASVRVEVVGAPPSGKLDDQASPTALVLPRGIGKGAWPQSRDAHLRRRFYLLGETLDGQRVWDVRRALALLPMREQGRDVEVTLAGRDDMAAVSLWAAVFEPSITSIELIDPPATVREGPALLNLERILDMPQAVALVFPRPVTLKGKVKPEDWRWAVELGEKLAPGRPWLTIQPGGE
jgi:dienelactone hydrolase